MLPGPKHTPVFTVKVTLPMIHLFLFTLLAEGYVVEDLVGVGAGPVAVKVHGKRSVDRFEPVVERDGSREHFREHGVFVPVSLLVHEKKEAARHSGCCDEGGATRRPTVRGDVVSCNVIVESPASLSRVKKRVECDEVGDFCGPWRDFLCGHLKETRLRELRT